MAGHGATERSQGYPPTPPKQFGIYAVAVPTGNLLFLTGMLPTEERRAKFIGRVGAELDVEAGHKATLAGWCTGLRAFRSARQSSWK